MFFIQFQAITMNNRAIFNHRKQAGEISAGLLPRLKSTALGWRAEVFAPHLTQRICATRDSKFAATEACLSLLYEYQEREAEIETSMHEVHYCCPKQCFVAPSMQVDGVACWKCMCFSFCHCKCKSHVPVMSSHDIIIQFLNAGGTINSHHCLDANFGYKVVFALNLDGSMRDTSHYTSDYSKHEKKIALVARFMLDHLQTAPVAVAI